MGEGVRLKNDFLFQDPTNEPTLQSQHPQQNTVPENSQQQKAVGFQSLGAGYWYLASIASSQDPRGSGTLSSIVFQNLSILFTSISSPIVF